MVDNLYTEKIYSKKIKGLKENCPDCRGYAKMKSTGYIYKSKLNYWVIEFVCLNNSEIIKMKFHKYNELVNEVLKDNGIEE